MIRPIVFGKFILLERISVGGMAEVYRAKLLNAPLFERFFAIKRILPNLAADEEFINMFIDEAKITVELDHPNVCQIYELGRLGLSHYIAMEYIPGRDVLAIQNLYRKQKKIMSVSQACFITMQVAQGLDYAHRAVDSKGQPLHVIHRDVSPQNLLVSFEGLVKLIDFGIAKAASKNTKTQSGVLKGKFGYMSPEQAENAYVDHRSDIFALGTVFWEMLTGRRLFHSDSEFATLQLISECEVVVPSKLNRMVPPEVDKIAMKALERDPEARYHWAGEMVRDLRDFILSCKPPFTQWHLQNWMCANFAEDLENEWNKLPIFQKINSVDEVRKFIAEQKVDESESQLKHKEVELDFEGNPIPELKSEESSEDPELYSASFDFSKSKNNESAKPAALPKFPPSREEKQVLEAKNKTEDNADETPTVDFEAVGGQASGNEGAARHEPSKPGLVAHTKERSSSVRLEGVIAKDNEEDVELVPEPVAPTVSDPSLQRYEALAKKRLMRRFLLISNIVLTFLMIVVLVLMKTGFLKLGTPRVEMPSSAVLNVEVVPVSDKASITLYNYPADQAPLHVVENASKASFSSLEAGRYLIEVKMPKYETEKFTVSIENGSSDTRLEMTKLLPEIVDYTVHVPFEDAQVFVNNEYVNGNGFERKLKGISGQEVNVTVKKNGYSSETQSIKLGSENELNFLLFPGIVDIQIDSIPSAYLWLETPQGFKRLGKTPYQLLGVEPSQAVNLELRATNYQTWKKKIEFKDKFERKLFVVLEKN